VARAFEISGSRVVRAYAPASEDQYTKTQLVQSRLPHQPCSASSPTTLRLRPPEDPWELTAWPALVGTVENLSPVIKVPSVLSLHPWSWPAGVRQLPYTLTTSYCRPRDMLPDRSNSEQPIRGLKHGSGRENSNHPRSDHASRRMSLAAARLPSFACQTGERACCKRLLSTLAGLLGTTGIAQNQRDLTSMINTLVHTHTPKMINCCVRQVGRLICLAILRTLRAARRSSRSCSCVTPARKKLAVKPEHKVERIHQRQ